MIYLFDENDQDQMSKQYRFDYDSIIPEFKKWLTHFSSIDQLHDIEAIIMTASLICLHDSFPPLEFKEAIIEKALNKKLPLVIFSGGAGFTISKFDETNGVINYLYLKQIKKDRFYYHFYDFLKEYVELNEINLQKIVFGRGYEKARVEIIKDRLGKNIFALRDNFDYFHFADPDEKSINHQNRKDLWELFYFLYKRDAEKEFTFFEERIEKEGVSAKVLYEKINHLLKQTNKNYE